MRKDDPILEGMASVLWGLAWSRHAEEHHCTDLTGAKIEEVMPPIPTQAYLLAAQSLGAIGQANGMGPYALLYKAAQADGFDPEDARLEQTKYRREFGNALAFMITGSGVSWFDNHEEFPLEMPHGDEYELQQFADENCIR